MTCGHAANKMPHPPCGIGADIILPLLNMRPEGFPIDSDNGPY